MKTCKGCGALKNKARFAKDTRGADGLSNMCKECYNKHHAKVGQAISDTAQKKRRVAQAKIMRRCGKCARYSYALGGCKVMKEPFLDCWAFTTDRSWEGKVDEAIRDYALGRRVR